MLVHLFVRLNLRDARGEERNSFPTRRLRAAWTEVKALKTRLLERDKSIAFLISRSTRSNRTHRPAADGLLLVVGVGEDLLNFARVIDRSGNLVHEWRPNWFELRPDDSYLPPDRRPKSLPG